MRKLIPVILICLIVLSACAPKTPSATGPTGQTQLANPWKSYDSLTDAENACGLTFPLPETVADGYGAASYRVMNGSLLEVTYQTDETKITVRMQSGDEPDISGVYETFHRTEITELNGASVTRKEAENCLVYLVHQGGYSYSVYATALTADDACLEIISHIC